MSKWVIKCVCGAKTGASRPGTGKSEFVNCCQCGRRLKVSDGQEVSFPHRLKQKTEEVDLLAVD